MDVILLILNIIISVAIISLILMQSRGTGLGSAWGGTGETVSTRRGMDLVILQITVFLIVCFFLLSAVKLAV